MVFCKYLDALTSVRSSWEVFCLFFTFVFKCETWTLSPSQCLNLGFSFLPWRCLCWCYMEGSLLLNAPALLGRWTAGAFAPSWRTLYLVENAVNRNGQPLWDLTAVFTWRCWSRCSQSRSQSNLHKHGAAVDIVSLLWRAALMEQLLSSTQHTHGRGSHHVLITNWVSHWLFVT